MSPLRLLRRAGLVGALCILLPAVATAQSERDPRLRVFLDCQFGGCDRNFFINELPFALWTQDRLDGDVHLLITRIGTASGGGEYTLTFLGQRRFASRLDTLVTQLPPNTTEDVRRRELARVMKLGLVPYLSRLPGQERFSLAYAAPANAPTTPALNTVADPWNLWVYRLRANGGGAAESRASNYELTSNVSASRVTEEWKVTFWGGQEYRFNRFKLSDSTERRFILRNADAGARIVRSVTEHWSVGGRLNTGFTEFRNQDLYGSIEAAAEYNLFPWKEATSRQLLGIVSLGGRYFDYTQETIYGQRTEFRPVARAIVAGESRQTWGTIDASARYTNYLHNSNTYSLSFNGRTNIRLSRGLSIELRGEAAKVNDQLFLARGSASDDEVLTRQRALATAFRLNGGIGLSFTFGSIYNSIVNPRLEDLGN
ncbi:MAG: hypothetical protein RL625_1754 [Gemmatimonadota bacterium]|jgi:hypothetical protein